MHRSGFLKLGSLNMQLIQYQLYLEGLEDWREGSIDRSRDDSFEELYIPKRGREKERNGAVAGKGWFWFKMGDPTDVYSQMGTAQEGAESGNTVERAHTCRSDICEKAGGDPAHAGGGPRRERGQSLPRGRREGRVRRHRGSRAGGWGAALWGRSLAYFHSVKSKVRSLAKSEEGVEVLEI